MHIHAAAYMYGASLHDFLSSPFVNTVDTFCSFHCSLFAFFSSCVHFATSKAHYSYLGSFYLSLFPVLSSLSVTFFPLLCPLLDKEVELLTLFYGSFQRGPWKPSHFSVSAALSRSQLRGKTPISLSPLYLSLSIPHSLSLSLSLSLSPSPLTGRPLTRSRQLQRSVCLLCRSSVTL